MIFHMARTRTTLIIDDAIFRDLKRLAVEESRTLSEVTQEVLREGLRGRRHRRRKGRPPRLPSFSMGRPAVDLSDREHLLDLLDGR